MAKTFAQIKAAVRQWLAVDQEDTDERLPDTVCGDLVNWAIKEYCRNRESRFGEANHIFPTVAETRDYPLPPRFSKPRKLWYLLPEGGIVNVDLVSKDDFDVKFPSSVVFSTGGPFVVPGADTSGILDDPTHYTIWGQKILLGKVPKRVLTLFMDYWQLPADLANASDTNLFSEAAEQYLIFKSLSGATLFGIEDERVPMWEAQAQKLESNLDSEDARRLVTGRRSQGRPPG